MSNKIPRWDETTEITDVPKWDDTVELSSAPIEITEQDKPVEFIPGGLRNILTLGGRLGSPQSVEDLAKSAAQGATFGFSDEMIGAGRALANAPSSDKSISDLYEQYRDMERRQLDTISEESPLSSLGAEFAGGMATGTPATALLKGAKILKNTDKLGRLGKIFEGTKSGALMGGAELAGRSEDDTLQGAFEGAGTGAMIGAAIPATLGSLSKSGGIVSKAIEESDTGRVFKRATEGKKSVGKEALETTSKEVEDISSKVMKAVDTLKDESKNIYNKIFDPGTKLPASELSSEFRQVLDSVQDITKESRNFKLLEQKLFSPAKGIIKNPNEIGADDLQRLKETINDIRYDRGVESDVREAADELFTKLNEYRTKIFSELETQSPNANFSQELKRANEIWQTLSRIEEIPGLRNFKNMSPEKRAQSLDNLSVKLKKTPGMTPDAEKEKTQIDRLLNYLKNVSPEEAERLKKDIPELTDTYEFVRRLEREPDSSWGARALTMLQRASSGIAQSAGEKAKVFKDKVVTPTKKVISPITGTLSKLPSPSQESLQTQTVRSSVADQSRGMSNKQPDELREDADRLMGNPSTKRLGEALLKALESENPQLKDSIINKIMQIPEGRKILQEE